MNGGRLGLRYLRKKKERKEKVKGGRKRRNTLLKGCANLINLDHMAGPRQIEVNEVGDGDLIERNS